MNDTFYRAACVKQHRIIGHYLSVQAWNRGLDCIVLNRTDLEFFFGLKRFKSIRVRWLKEDLRPWFPHQEDYYKTGAKSSIHSLFLSRVPIAQALSSATMTTAQRIERMPAGAPRTALFMDERWLDKRPTEAEMHSQLMLLAAGLATPESFKPKPPPRAQTKTPETFIDPFNIFSIFFGGQKETEE